SPGVRLLPSTTLVVCRTLGPCSTMGTGTIPPRDDARSAPPDPPTDDIPIVEISNRRRWIASLAVAVLVGGSAFDVLMAREDWPFSSYPMFSSVRSSEL